MTKATVNGVEVTKEELKNYTLYVPSFGRIAREKGIILDLGKKEKEER